MVVNGEKYLPVNTAGNSIFEIPVLVFDKAMTVTADTTAMSTPHEIEYTLTFDKASIQSSTNSTAIAVGVALAVGAAVAVSLIFRKKKGTSNEA